MEENNTAEITTWKTKDGRTLKIAEMDDNHLINTICFLRRRGFINHKTWTVYFQGSGPNGEGAQDAFEAEADYVLSHWPSSSLTALEQEATRRGVDWEPRLHGPGRNHANLGASAGESSPHQIMVCSVYRVPWSCSVRPNKETTTKRHSTRSFHASG